MDKKREEIYCLIKNSIKLVNPLLVANEGLESSISSYLILNIQLNRPAHIINGENRFSNIQGSLFPESMYGLWRSPEDICGGKRLIEIKIDESRLEEKKRKNISHFYSEKEQEYEILIKVWASIHSGFKSHDKYQTLASTLRKESVEFLFGERKTLPTNHMNVNIEYLPK